MVFIWYLFRKLGAPELFCNGRKIASCGSVMEIMSAQKRSYKDAPKKGDLVIFDFSGNHTAHTHIGLVTEITSSSSFKTIEGNTGNRDYTNGGYVLEQTRYISQVNCFIRPNYEKEKKRTAELIENGALYEKAYKDIAGKSSKRLARLRKGDKVELDSDDGWGWSKVYYGSEKGYIMNRHLNKKGLSSFKTYTLKADAYAQPIINQKIYPSEKLRKGIKYQLICEIESGAYKGRKYIAVDKKRYYL